MRALVALLALVGMQGVALQVASAAPPPETLPKVTDPQEAAVQVNFEVQLWDARRRGCSTLLPEHARGIGGLYLHWLDENTAPVRAMLAYGEHSKTKGLAFSVVDEGLPGDGLEEAARYNMAPRDFCARLFGSLKAGEFDIVRSYPDVAELLSKYLATHPLSTQGARAYDNPLGCMKGAYNSEMSYDAAQPMCRCLWNAMNSEFTQTEWTEYEAAVSNGKTQQQVEALPQFKRALPKIEACSKPTKSG